MSFLFRIVPAARSEGPSQRAPIREPRNGQGGFLHDRRLLFQEAGKPAPWTEPLCSAGLPTKSYAGLDRVFGHKAGGYGGQVKPGQTAFRLEPRIVAYLPRSQTAFLEPSPRPSPRQRREISVCDREGYAFLWKWSRGRRFRQAGRAQDRRGARSCDQAPYVFKEGDGGQMAADPGGRCLP